MSASTRLYEYSGTGGKAPGERTALRGEDQRVIYLRIELVRRIALPESVVLERNTVLGPGTRVEVRQRGIEASHSVGGEPEKDVRDCGQRR